ncbi:YHYH domain-containing protein [Neobacillus sp. PS3-12]|uniref:YHYH domain-containing protein n=1 Tax=Neobacillus sp. PS3-12 TaxID=3070677 RepID=UPI0035A9A989
MKQKFLTFITIGLIVFAQSSVVSAHPGRTDANGGHYCWTNCGKWGLSYGQYHYHNGGGSTSSGGGSSSSSSYSSQQSIVTPTPAPVPKVDPVQVEADEHYQDAQGHYKAGEYYEALNEIKAIYDLGKQNNSVQSLERTILSNMYTQANTDFQQGKYTDASTNVNQIINYAHTPSDLLSQSQPLSQQIDTYSKASDYFDLAKGDRADKKYKDAIDEAQKSESLVPSNEKEAFIAETTIELKQAVTTAYENRDYTHVKSYGKMANSFANETEKSQIQKLESKSENEQLIQKELGIKLDDRKKDNLFNHINQVDGSPKSDQSVVKGIKEFLIEKAGEKMKSISSTKLSDFLKGA